MAGLVLLADADPFELRLVCDVCAHLGYEVATAADGSGVLDAIARDRPVLVVMDTSLPGIDGQRVLEILKADPELRQVPVVLATARDDDAARRRALALGAADYVTKPYRTSELQERLRNVLRLRAVLGSDAPHPDDDLAQAIDPAVGSGTSAQLHMSLEYEFTRASRYAHPLGCVVVRHLNHGEIAAVGGAAAAQRSLDAVARVLRGCIRSVDQLFLSAPREITLLLPETGDEGCAIVVERVRARAADVAVVGAPLPIIALGVACYPSESATSGEALWRLALGRAVRGAD